MSKRITLTERRIFGVKDIIDDSINELRLKVLHGELEGFNCRGQDDKIVHHFGDLSDAVIEYLEQS